MSIAMMRSAGRLCCLAACWLLAASNVLAQATPRPTQISGGISYTLASQALGDEREINVWVPPQYEDSEERYNVLYVLDGAVSQDFPHIAGLGQLGALSYTYEPLIVVGVETRVRQRELTPVPRDRRYIEAFPNAGGAGDFRRFLREEVIPFIESRYRVGARRALVGESLAGLFVVDTFLSSPDLFSDYIAVSPSLWWDDRALARNARRALQGRAERRQTLYLTLADEGGTMADGMARLVEALRAEDPHGLDWVFVDRSAEETHATIYHGAVLHALRRNFALPPYDAGPAPWFMIEDAAPPAAPSE